MAQGFDSVCSVTLDFMTSLILLSCCRRAAEFSYRTMPCSVQATYPIAFAGGDCLGEGLLNHVTRLGQAEPPEVMHKGRELSARSGGGSIGEPSRQREKRRTAGWQS